MTIFLRWPSRNCISFESHAPQLATKALLLLPPLSIFLRTSGQRICIPLANASYPSSSAPMVHRSRQPLPSSLFASHLILHRQIHAHPPRTQPYPLLLTHPHARIISLNQRQIRPLCLYILRELLRLLDLRVRVRRGFGERVADAFLQRRGCGELLVGCARGGGASGDGEFAQETAVEGAELGGGL
jgi:hypothetical protein